MAGKIKRYIDAVVYEKAKGNQTLIKTTRTKLILKGIVPESYNEHSADDPVVLAKLEKLASEMGVVVRI